ncbi:MAG: hypothetical protein K6E26_07865, partial [Clostridiales bacterium]|nr:hypothetical protein [Clostridiales bacterium]
WDIYEEQGMLGANGRFYYSEPNKLDSDNDNVDDVVEMGKRYRIVVDSENNIMLNGDPLSDYVFTSPNEMALASLFVNLGQGEWTIYSVVSDPSDVDTDNDDATDDVDATPMRKNPYASYILYGPEDNWNEFDYEVNHRKKKYEKAGEKAFAMPVKKMEDFADSWNQMGMDMNSGQVAYRIDEVVIISHGTARGTQLSIGVNRTSIDFIENGVWYRMYSPHELVKKKIKTLTLAACYSGSLSNLEDNIAIVFLFSIHDIRRVVAWDGQTKYAHFLEISLHDFSFHHDEEYSSEPFWNNYKGEVIYEKYGENSFVYYYEDWKE